MTPLEMGATCTYCGGELSADATGWSEDNGATYCPGCRTVVHGDAAGVIDSARSEFAAARTLIRACDEIDDCYRRLDPTVAATESEPQRHVIEEVGHALDKVNGEAAMRKALLLVGADCDPNHLVTPMAGGTAMDPARKATLTSHKRYIEREWSGVGLWQE
ncbi:MAG TPA: hypothetical protein VFJ17_12450 [Mycobacteriales bacterium]|jgi:hypothetical protein|nr:hypothetical protein [Mycobacteriales bacterium]